jgi:hypothetical protein
LAKHPENMIDFIIKNHGGADYYDVNRSIKARPNYDDVDDFLRGLIDFQELKRRLGC